MGVWTAGIVLAGLGIALRTWAVCHCNYAQGRPKSLATSGPYSLIRNPLYVGNILILAGATAASELAWLLPIAVCWAFAIYSLAIRHEEARLLDRYGEDFLRYAACVPRWVPRNLLETRVSVRLHRPIVGAFVRQCTNLALLLPFALKEIHFFGSWPHL